MVVQQETRPVSAAQWSKALERAIDAGVDILTEPISGQTFCESTRHPGIVYVVTRESCSCIAGAHGSPCLHRACLLAQRGELPLPAPAACLWCNASGRQEDPLHERFVTCPDCHGTGTRIDTRPQGLPSVMPVAAAA